MVFGVGLDVKKSHIKVTYAKIVQYANFELRGREGIKWQELPSGRIMNADCGSLTGS